MDAGAVAAQERLLQAVRVEHDPADMLALSRTGRDRGGQRLVSELDRQVGLLDQALCARGPHTWEQQQKRESGGPPPKGSSQTHDYSSDAPRLEIRLARPRNVAVPAHKGAARILSANTFHHGAQCAAVSDRGGPGRGENAVILDRERKLQPLAAIGGVERRAGIAAATDEEVLLQASGLPFSCGRVINEPIALDDVHRRALRDTQIVHHGDGADLDPDGVDYQGVAFIMTDRISVPGWRHLRGMLLIHPHVPYLVVKII